MTKMYIHPRPKGYVKSGRTGRAAPATGQTTAARRFRTLRAAHQNKRRNAPKTATAPGLKFEKIRRDGPVSESSIHVPLPGKTFNLGKLSKLLGDQTFTTDSSLSLSQGAGRQGSSTLAGFWNGTDMSFMLAQAALLSASIANVKNYKLYLKEMTAEMRFTNKNNDVAHLVIYDVISRRDCYNTNYNDPVNAWLQGLSDQAGAGAGATVQNNLMSKPFASSLFCEYYKVIAIKDVMLHTGGHHVHKVHSMPKKLFNNEIQLINAGGTNARGYSHFTFATVSGFPIADNAGTTITSALAGVDVVIAKNYTWALMQNNNAQPIVQHNISNAPAQQNLVNDLTGAVTVIAGIA